MKDFIDEKKKKKKTKQHSSLQRRHIVPTNVSNRELGFLHFNERVLALAEDESVPLLERLRFLCISCDNLDEFYEIRVSGIKQKIEGGVEGAGIDGLSSQQEMNLIAASNRALVARQYQLFNDVLIPGLASEDIRFLHRSEWTDEIKNWVKHYFDNDIAPVLSPLGLDTSHPFPRLTNKSLNFVIDLEGIDAFGRDSGYALLRAPRSLPRFIAIPEEVCGIANGFVFLSSIVHSQMSSLFSGMNPVGVYQFRVTRNSDLYVSDEEVANLRRALEEELLERNFGSAVRLEVAENCPPKIARFLLTQFRLEDEDLIRVNGPVNLNRLSALADQIDRPDLKYPAFTPQVELVFDTSSDIFERIKAKEFILFHHPYQSYLPVLEMVKQAARDPSVLAIKQTLYRTGSESAFVTYLMEASRAGKDVTVVIELRARFDEEANLQLASRLEEAGIQVVYGVVGFKTHAKMLLIVRREKTKLVNYLHIGTGNYHATTARSYTDLSLLTNNKSITRDVQRIFTQLTGLGKIKELKTVIQAPFNLHSFVMEHIARERKTAENGGKGHIIARMNSLVDTAIINELYKASKAGVKIELVVRGICILKAGVPGLSENIRVVSVLGRFLEHSRVFFFHNSGEQQLYLSSADWMPRNFFTRVEIAVPVPAVMFNRVKEECLDFYLADNQFCWEMQPDGSYERLSSASEPPFSAQNTLIRRYGADITPE